MNPQIRKQILISCFFVLGGVCVALFALGCATIIHGTKQEVGLKSVPTGAKVVLKGGHVANTPAVIVLRREEFNPVLRFEKEGYMPVDVVLSRDIDPWIVGNIVFGGLIGLAVDFISGGAYQFNPTEVNVVLEEVKKQGMDLENMPEGSVIVVAVDLRDLRK